MCTHHYLQNSATQKQPISLAATGDDSEVLLYWVSPAEQADAVTIVFWSVNQCMHIRAAGIPAPPPFFFLVKNMSGAHATRLIVDGFLLHMFRAKTTQRTDLSCS